MAFPREIPKSHQYFSMYRDEIGEELYEPYGGLNGLPGLVRARCEDGSCCNNPLSYGEEEHFNRVGPEKEASVEATLVTAHDNLAIQIFLQQLPGIDRNIGWNYEPHWVSELMVQHPQELLEAQWVYLDYYKRSVVPEVSGDFTDMD